MLNDLNNHLTKEFNIGRSTINIKVDKECEKLLFLCKKNYAFIQNGELKAKGLDYIKTSTLKYAANLQRDLLERILFKNEKDFQKIFEKYHKEFHSLEFNESNLDLITLQIRVTKHPSKYAVKSTPALIAQWMIDNKMNFYPGLFVPIVVTGYRDNKMEGVHPSSGLWKGKIDKNYVWDHQILPKLSRITEVLDKNFDWKQFDSSIVSIRDRKIRSYEKRLLDTKTIDQVLETIKNDTTLSPKQIQDLVSFGTKNKTRSLW